MDLNKMKLTTALLFSSLSMGMVSATQSEDVEFTNEAAEQNTSVAVEEPENVAVQEEVSENLSDNDYEAPSSSIRTPRRRRNVKRIKIPRRSAFEGSPYIVSSPYRIDANLDKSIFSANEFVNSPCFSVSQPLPTMMTHKETQIFQGLVNNTPYMFGTGEDQEPQGRAEFLAIVKLWADREQRTDFTKPIEVDSSQLGAARWNVFGNRHGHIEIDSEIIKSIAKYIKCSVLYTCVGNNGYGCIDILKRMIYVKYDSERNDIGANFDKKSRIDDSKLFDMPQMDTKNTLIICYNSALRRYLFSLPYENDVPVLDLTKIGDLGTIERKIVKMNNIRSFKNKALIGVPVTIGVAIATYLSAKFGGTALDGFKSFFSNLKCHICNLIKTTK